MNQNKQKQVVELSNKIATITNKSNISAMADRLQNHNTALYLFNL
jgi:hypothetical protein